MVREPLASLNLIGDGDEIDAVWLVEERLKVSFDPSRAAKWLTVGDIFRDALQLVPEPASHRRTWIRLCVALCCFQGDDPRRVRPNTILIGGRVPVWAYFRKFAADLRSKWLG